MLTSMPALMSWAYLDEIAYKYLSLVRPQNLSGSSLTPNYPEKVDAGRTLLFFTTNKENITANCSITSSLGATYTAFKINSNCIIIPGVKRGDFVKINFE